MDQAVGWVKSCPNPMRGPSEIEIRPLFGPEDLRWHAGAGGCGCSSPEDSNDGPQTEM